MRRKIAVAGSGYVGLSLAVLLAQSNKVTVVDIIPENWKKLIRESVRFRMSILKNI